MGIFLMVWGGASLVFAQNNLGRGPLTSPRIVNLDGNPFTLKIIAADEAGNLNGFNGLGGLLWSVPLRLNGTTPTSVQGTPAAADMNGNGLLDIVVTTGNVNFQSASPGGVFVAELRDAGGTLPPLVRHIFTFENRNVDPPDGVPDSSIVSPAIADVNADGFLDIVVGSFDQIVRVLDINGTPRWFEFVNEPTGPALIAGLKTGDTIFSSPAVANIDFDIQAEVIIGIEANEVRNCAAPLNFTLAKRGGAFLFIDGFFGKIDTGLLLPLASPDPACPNKTRVKANINQPINSTPAIADINGDIFLDIVSGTGRFLAGFPTSGPTV
ncbi:MAG: VCBS repeat-containing protein, partial [Nitrospira sp.]|nr:VCBS repeat-containing protein [Nitrospira sp.]